MNEAISSRTRTARLAHRRGRYGFDASCVPIILRLVGALGWRFWYGGPWVATALVSAVKPD